MLELNTLRSTCTEYYVTNSVQGVCLTRQELKWKLNWYVLCDGHCADAISADV